MNENCRKTGKARLTRNDAKSLVRTAIELHHYYKCPHCDTFHVSSQPKPTGRKGGKKFKR